jgi:hypothetical protein
MPQADSDEIDRSQPEGRWDRVGHLGRRCDVSPHTATNIGIFGVIGVHSWTCAEKRNRIHPSVGQPRRSAKSTGISRSVFS